MMNRRWCRMTVAVFMIIGFLLCTACGHMQENSISSDGEGYVILDEGHDSANNSAAPSHSEKKSREESKTGVESGETEPTETIPENTVSPETDIDEYELPLVPAS